MKSKMTIENRIALELSKFRRSRELYFASVLDLRDKLNSLKSQVETMQAEYETADLGAIEIEEFCDENGKIDFIAEQRWIDSIRTKTGMDCRIIKGYNETTIPMLGLYKLELVGVENDKVCHWTLNVWVVPVQPTK